MKCNNPKKHSAKLVEIVQIGVKQPPKAMTVREMFEDMAQRESEMIREARSRARVEAG